ARAGRGADRPEPVAPGVGAAARDGSGRVRDRGRPDRARGRGAALLRLIAGAPGRGLRLAALRRRGALLVGCALGGRVVGLSVLVLAVRVVVVFVLVVVVMPVLVVVLVFVRLGRVERNVQARPAAQDRGDRRDGLLQRVQARGDAADLPGEEVLVVGEDLLELLLVALLDRPVLEQVRVDRVGKLVEALSRLPRQAVADVLHPERLESARRRHVAPEAGAEGEHALGDRAHRAEPAARVERVQAREAVAQLLGRPAVGEHLQSFLELLQGEMGHEVRLDSATLTCGRPALNRRPVGERLEKRARRGNVPAGMLAFLLRRIAQMVPLLLGITFISFLVVGLAPGDFFSALAMNPSISPDAIAAMKREFGYGQPLVVRYLAWLGQVVRGDLGLSVAHRIGVATLIGQRVGNTLLLAVAALIVTWAAAIPLGVLVAVRRGRLSDRALSLFAFLGMSVPNFFLAFLLLRLALFTGWFPVGGTVSLDYEQLSLAGKLADRLHHLVLPTIVLATGGMAGLMRLMRGAILELQRADFVRTALAKGLPERVVLFKHVLRNALNPFVTLAGYELGTLLGGAALVENVMNLQGLGALMLEAVMALDIYLVMGSVLIGSAMLLVGNLLADVALMAVDPRIDFSRLEAAR